MKLAVLIGRGSRLPNLYERLRVDPEVEFRVVISHKKESSGIDFAKSNGIEAFYFRVTDWYKEKMGRSSLELSDDERHRLRKSYMTKLASILQERTIDLVFMTGWDLILLNEFLSKFPKRVLNIHPSLLPAFPGENAWVQALERGVKVTGATVHFVVDESVDSGPIILQETLRLEENETADSLRQKLNVIEDGLGPKAIKLFVSGKPG